MGDAQEKHRRVSLGCKDKSVARSLLADIERRIDRERDGRVDRYSEHRKTPLRTHLTAYRTYLENKGNSKQHVTLTLNRIHNIFEVTRTVYIRDIDAAKIQAYLANRQTSGLSVKSCNHYVRAVKMFCNWLCKYGRNDENALNCLALMNAEVDPRHQRRPLTENELARLLNVAQNGPTFFGLSGPERALLYKLAAYTGMRANEIRSLLWRNLDLESDCPTITIPAAFAKNRKEARQPLPPWLAKDLLEWRQTHRQRPETPIFPKLTRKTADMLKCDLKAAGIPYRDASGRVVDFHALRATCGTLLAKAGVHPKLAQDILRHSDIRLTMKHYTHTLLEDRPKAVGQLPNLSRDDSDAADASAKTGTYDAECLTHQLTQTTDVSGRDMSCRDQNDKKMAESEFPCEIADSSQNISVSHP